MPTGMTTSGLGMEDTFRDTSAADTAGASDVTLRERERERTESPSACTEGTRVRSALEPA